MQAQTEQACSAVRLLSTRVDVLHLMRPVPFRLAVEPSCAGSHVAEKLHVHVGPWHISNVAPWVQVNQRRSTALQ